MCTFVNIPHAAGEMGQRAATKQINILILGILLLTFVRHGSSQTEYISGSLPPLPTNGKFFKLIEVYRCILAWKL